MEIKTPEKLYTRAEKILKTNFRELKIFCLTHYAHYVKNV